MTNFMPPVAWEKRIHGLLSLMDMVMVRGRAALSIDANLHPQNSDTIVTMGRGNADVMVEGVTISRTQCSFEIKRDTNLIMLCDKSRAANTHVGSEKKCLPFVDGQPRQVTIWKDLNDILGIDSPGIDITWSSIFSAQLREMTTNRQSSRNGTVKCLAPENPTATVAAMETIIPSADLRFRVHTAPARNVALRYHAIDRLGQGNFGTVYKAAIVATGDVIAVKRLRVCGSNSCRQVQREVDALCRMNHPHIVEFLAYFIVGDNEIDICMRLKDGSVESLMLGQKDFKVVKDLVSVIFFQMLQALDFMAFHEFIHRDVKPANILYLRSIKTFTFQLGDFGLSEQVDSNATEVGTKLYGAPEVFLSRGSAQTPAVDIWSLFVTMLWILDIQSFRSRGPQLEVEARTARIMDLAGHDRMKKIAEMARVNPRQRASAAQMLVKCYNGQGLTTRRENVLPISPVEDNVLLILPTWDPMDID
ncbi:hypothetical protein E4U43_005355 [Claviceps pusilla]|uniref:mitogen-activated protein kinase kinase n=1 Tax=Claviceps pusilla TaxID=123648 RepID=A0A9P7NFF7_9HYPO|nr:hypothetical protein E4U43_005355 [Claviceps pusilla]